MSTRNSIKRWVLAALFALPMAVPHTVSAANDAAPGAVKHQSKLYIVEMIDPPAVAYTGGIAGLKATKPNRGKKIDPLNNDVVKYVGHLTAKHDAALQGVGGANKAYSYKFAFNGFAAELSDAQVEKMKSMPGVLAVSKDEMYSLDTSTTPAFLGLSNANGLWQQLSGSTTGVLANGPNSGGAGEGIVIGMVDSGIWPEHPSFSDRDANGKLVYQQIPGWHGKCTHGEAFDQTNCNLKLISARYYNSGFGGNAGIDEKFPFEFNSPRDWDGHGTHTSSTAGGNALVPSTGPASALGSINGMAPRARIAVYKVCWADTPSGGGCFGSDSVAAIDQAVADGVDVINFSISGSITNFRDPVEIAWLFAADAGVFVAASAGNSGPAVSTVAHPSPWITTVAAGTHNRNGEGSVTLGNGAVYTGASFANALSATAFVDSANAVAAGATALDAERCRPGALDATKVAGMVVLCKRGVYALVDKSLAVAEAGGVGMVLYNDPAGATSTLALIHSVPTVHVVAASGLAIKSYIANTAAPTAAIAQATIVFNTPAPFTADFSSRGPSLAAAGDILKPDIIAPGQDIFAAIAPPANEGRLFDLLSGTSMSSPHMAGIGALFKQLHPEWSPMAIKSALMTTAGDVLDGPNTIPAVIFRQGAGHVQPNAARNPGLVFDSGFADWLSFICGVQPGGGCTGVTPINPSNMNTASIALGAMPGSQVVKRRVTNVGGSSATYTPSFTGLVGISTVVSPATLTLASGETKEFTVTFTNASAPVNVYQGGQLTLSDGTHNVRIPVVVRPVIFSAPAEVSGSYSVKFGYTGAFTATPRGLVAAVKTPGSVATGGVVNIPVTIPAGTTYARFSLFDSEVSQPSDLDLEVYNSSNTLVGSSGGSTAAEEVNLLNPAAGTYTVRVVGFAVPVGAANFTLFNWALGSTDAGNMSVTAPAAATLGTTGTIGISTSVPPLLSATKYLGSVVYSGGASGQTIVRIDTP